LAAQEPTAGSEDIDSAITSENNEISANNIFENNESTNSSYVNSITADNNKLDSSEIQMNSLSTKQKLESLGFFSRYDNIFQIMIVYFVAWFDFVFRSDRDMNFKDFSKHKGYFGLVCHLESLDWKEYCNQYSRDILNFANN